VIMGNNTGDDNSTLDPRLDLAISPPNYTFTDIRKELGLYKRSGVRKRELDKIWKVLRRKVRDEIASENLRDIRKTIEPDRLHSETLRIARKMLSQQEPWNEVSASQKKLEKLAYALVCREYCIVGEKAAGFGCDKNPAKRPVKDRKAKSQVKITPAVKSPSKRGRNSIRKETTYVRSDIFPEDSSDSVYDYNDHKRLRRSRRCAAARLTTRSPTAEATDEHEDNTDSPNSSFTMNSYPNMPSGASAKSSAGKKGTIYNDIPLVQRKDVVEIKRMELEAEEMWLAVFEKKEAFKKKYGVSYNYAF